MKNHWLGNPKKCYQLAFFRDGEWYHSLGLGDYEEDVRRFHLREEKARLIVHDENPDMYYKYHVDHGEVIMEK